MSTPQDPTEAELAQVAQLKSELKSALEHLTDLTKSLTEMSRELYDAEHFTLDERRAFANRLQRLATI